MSTPTVGLVLHPRFSPFHFSVPYMVFGMTMPGERYFDLKIVSPGGRAQQAERAMTVQPDGGLELLDAADIVVVPGWHDLGGASGARTGRGAKARARAGRACRGALFRRLRPGLRGAA